MNFKKIINKEKITSVVGLTAGGIGAKMIVNKAFGSSSMSSTTKNVIAIVGGLVLMTTKSKMMQNVGAGIITVAGTNIAAEKIPGIAGICEPDWSDIQAAYHMAGTGNAPAVFGPGNSRWLDYGSGVFGNQSSSANTIREPGETIGAVATSYGNMI